MTSSTVGRSLNAPRLAWPFALMVAACSSPPREESHGTVAVGGESGAAAAVAVTSVEIRKAGAIKSLLRSPRSPFDTDDTILAVVHTHGRARTAELMVRWRGTDGALVNETTQERSLGGTDAVEFRLAPVGGWPRGALSAEVFVNGALARATSFRVR